MELSKGMIGPLCRCKQVFFMKWDDVGDQPCSVARTMAVIGDRWTMLVLRNAFMGTRRFDNFQQR